MIAVCGPGRQLRTALILLLTGEDLPSEIRESAHLSDPEMIILIDPGCLPPLPPFPPWTGR